MASRKSGRTIGRCSHYGSHDTVLPSPPDPARDPRNWKWDQRSRLDASRTDRGAMKHFPPPMFFEERIGIVYERDEWKCPGARDREPFNPPKDRRYRLFSLSNGLSGVDGPPSRRARARDCYRPSLWPKGVYAKRKTKTSQQAWRHLENPAVL